MQLLSVLATLTSSSVSCVVCIIGHLKTRFRLKRMYQYGTPHQTQARFKIFTQVDLVWGVLCVISF